MSVTKLHAGELGQLAKVAAAGEDMAVPESFTARRPSVEESLAAGKALREKVPRADHARYPARPHREDPVTILEQQAETRVQKLVPVRYARMLASPFSFLRGSAAVMAADLAGTPATGPFVNACGDMHVANFGVYASAERNLVFGINDFDEVHPGPWEWDLKRLAASAVVAASFMGGDKGEAAEAARAIVRSYRKRIRRYAEMGYLEVWYNRIDDKAVLDTLSPRVRRRAERILDKARAKGHVQVLDKLTEQVDGEHRIIENVPLIVREIHTEAGTPINVALDRLLRPYLDSLTDDRRRLLSRYRIVDVARKVVGVGSVGTACWGIPLATFIGPASRRQAVMTARRFVVVGLLSIASLCTLPDAWAQGIHMVESAPTARAVIGGRSSEFFVRFDAPVDHARSLLVIMRDGDVVETLHPRLESAPEVLFARAPTLTAGVYRLHWSVRSMAGADIVEGDIPFRVEH